MIMALLIGKMQKKKTQLRFSQKGIALIDVLVGFSLMALSVGLAIVVIFGAQSTLTDRGNEITARTMARDGLNGALSILKNGWGGVADGTYGLSFSSGVWQFSGAQDIDGIFTRQIFITTIESNEKEIKSIVNWAPSLVRPLSVELSQRVSNWENVENTGGDIGGDLPTGDWTNPQTAGTLDLGAGNSGTDLDVLNKIVYMTAEASTVSKHDFFIINATNPQSPFQISSLDIGTGLWGLDTTDDYAYVVGKDNTKELQIIDINDIASPFVASTLNLTGNEDALCVFYNANYLYIGRAGGANYEFNIIDVSDPYSPYVVAELSNVGDEINDVYVSGDRAYITTEDSSRGMIMIDITDKENPSVLGSFDIGDHIYGVYVQDFSKVFMGDHTDFYIASTTNPLSTYVLDSGLISAKTRDIVTAGSYAFLATEHSNKEFQAWNIANLSNISLIASFNFPQIATGIDYEDNYVYVSVRSNSSLRIITSTP